MKSGTGVLAERDDGVRGGADMSKATVAAAFGLLGCALGGMAGWFASRGAAAEVTELRDVVARHEARIAQLEHRGQSLEPPRRSQLDDLAGRVARLEASASTLPPSAVSAATNDSADAVARVKRALDKLKEVERSQPIALRDALAELVRVGDAAVPEITALLDSGFDRSLGGEIEMRGKEVASYPTLRLVLFDALRQIGTPSARQGSAVALGRSDRMSDLEAIWMYWSGGRDTPDPVVADGVSRLASSMVRKVASTGLDGLDLEGDARPVQLLVAWLRAHGRAEDASAIEDLLRHGPPKDAMALDSYLRVFSALIRVAPDRAADVASTIVAGGPRGRSQLVAIMESSYDVPASSQSRYLEALFAQGDVDSKLRAELYSRIPGPNPADHKAQFDPLIQFLDTRALRETDAAAKSGAERALQRLRDDLARLKD